MDPRRFASFVSDETFVEHVGELRPALGACHWKNWRLENVAHGVVHGVVHGIVHEVVVQDGKIAVFDA